MAHAPERSTNADRLNKTREGFVEPWICVQCGAHFEGGGDPPSTCRICEDERQFVRWSGQAWTTMPELRRGHRLEWRDDHGVLGIGMTPGFAIEQRALLLDRPDGSVMWDCVPLVTDEAVAMIQARGGVKAIAVSHPHFYGAMASWSEALGDVPVYVHADDRAWITRPHASIVLWSGERYALDDALTLVRGGGHFPGASLLHDRRDGGALFAGDTAMVTMDRRWLSFMFSYPNSIPLDGQAVRGIQRALDGLTFDRIYSAWWDRVIATEGRAVFDKSVARYLAAISGGRVRHD